MKKFFFYLLLIILAVFLFSCGGAKCEECVDTDGDGICDACGDDIGSESSVENVALIEDGIPGFKIVLGSDISTDVQEYVDEQIVEELKKTYGIELIAAKEGDSSDEIQDVEVLIGDVTTRGDKYVSDRYELGKEGYFIKIIGKKIVINAGSDETLVDTVEKFAEDILKIGSDGIYNAAMTSADAVYKVQDDYKIESLSVGSADMKGYTIAADLTDKYYSATALLLQDTFYNRTGYYFKIVSTDEATDKSIVLRRIDKISGDDSFTVKTDGTRLVISCAFDNLLEQATGEFLTQFITFAKEKNVSFEGTVFKRDVSVVYYEDFGAVGDGRANDYQAFYDTHVFANECGQTVVADDSKTYLLGQSEVTVNKVKKILPIPIRTNVKWGEAKIIVDDSSLDYFDAKTQQMATTVTFLVESDYEALTWLATDREHADTFESIGKIGYSYDTEKIDLGLGYPAMLIIYNDNHEVYRRSGASYSGAGSAQHELIVIDTDGNIDESTPFMFDYDELTKIQILRLDIEPITISGGTVTTVAPQFDQYYTYPGSDGKTVEMSAGYYYRGLSIQRHYTTVDGLKHYVENEVTVEQYFNDHVQGADYQGFFSAAYANDVLIKNCVMTGRRYYNTRGTYEFGANCVNKIVLKNCYQHNFWVEEDGSPSDENTGRTSMDSVSYNGLVAENGKTAVQYCWGLGGTNFCKNMHYIDSRLSRFDAHQGLYDGSIEGCEISFFEIIGKGTFLLKDTTYYSNGSSQLVYLRPDYGCTWEGDFIIENVHCYVPPNKQFNVFLHHREK